MSIAREIPSGPPPRPSFWQRFQPHWWKVIAILLLLAVGIVFVLWLQERNEAATLTERNAQLVAEHTTAIARKDDRIADLSAAKAELENQLGECNDRVAELIQLVDRLESELDRCLDKLHEPQRLQTLLPGLMRDYTTTIFVIDDSGSMASLTGEVQEALRNIQAKNTEGARVSVALFGDNYMTMFSFIEPTAAPWSSAVESVRADKGGTNLDLALLEAYRSIESEPNVNKRIVLVTDGYGGNGSISPEAIVPIQTAEIPVDTVSFGPVVNHRFLEWIAQETNGTYQSAN